MSTTWYLTDRKTLSLKEITEHTDIKLHKGIDGHIWLSLYGNGFQTLAKSAEESISDFTRYGRNDEILMVMTLFRAFSIPIVSEHFIAEYLDTEPEIAEENLEEYRKLLNNLIIEEDELLSNAPAKNDGWDPYSDNGHFID